MSTTRKVDRALWLCWLGEAHLHGGRADAAAALASQSLDAARAFREADNEAHARRLLGVATRATVELRHALAGRLGMRPLVARCHLGLGALERADPARSRKHRETGSAMQRELGIAQEHDAP